MKNTIVKIYNKIFKIKSEIFDAKNKILKLINKMFDNISLLLRKFISRKRDKSSLKFKFKLNFNARLEFLKTKIMKLR